MLKGFNWLRTETIGVLFEHVNATHDSIRSRQFLDQMTDC
jgi:hypothetical protein